MDLFWQITIVEFLLNIAVFAAAVIAFGLVRAVVIKFFPGKLLVEQVVTGLLFGTATATCLLMPIHMSGGAAVGGQTILLVLAAPLAGFAAALSAGVVALAGAVYLWTSDPVAGITAFISASGSLLLGALARWIFTRYRPEARQLPYFMLPLLGVLSAVAVLASVAPGLDWHLLQASIVSVTGTSILASLILGTLLLHEKRRHDAERELRENELRLAAQAVDLTTARDAAETANRVKGDFLANMSHEIRTPINGVLGMTELILDTPLNDEQRRFAEIVRESGEALLTVINDILDISKLEAGKIELEVIDFDLLNTVESVVALMTGKARQKNIDLCIYVEPAAQGTYHGDPMRIRQVLLNLLGNAIKFTDKGGVSVEVVVTRAADIPVTDDNVPLRFAIQDTGIGMPESVRLRLFEKFTQADSSVTRRYGGTGLGLAISKQLVELMGGRIDVTSRLGVGSTFAFEIALPRAAATIVDRGQIPDKLKGLRTLIVDDIALNIEIVGRQLSGFGMDVQGVSDGFDGLAALERAWHRGTPYDLAFVDEMMPGLSGHGLAQRIRANPVLAELKIVLVSSSGRHGLEYSRELFDAVLEKPVRQHDLFDTLINIYGHKLGKITEKIVAEPRKKLTTQTRGLKVLLAEDNKINQQFAIHLLQKAGHTVTLAENGHQAVDALRANDFDVVLMDVQMPELDGVEATKQIRNLNSARSRIPIIAMTAHAMAGAREEYLAAGMDEYISKPVQPALLLEMLARIADGVEQSPEANLPTAVPSEDVLAILDTENLALIENVMGVEKAGEFLQQTLREMHHNLDAILGARKDEDHSVIGKVAHTLVSTAGNVGALQVSLLARELEHACRKGDVLAIDARIAKLQNAAADASLQILARLDPSNSQVRKSILRG